MWLVKLFGVKMCDGEKGVAKPVPPNTSFAIGREVPRYVR